MAALNTQEDTGRQNLTDPDAPIMKGKKRDYDTYYNVQAACNENQIISFCDVVTAGNDKAQLIPALKGIEANTSQKVKQALADADYGNFDSLAYMKEQGIEGFVPYQNMSTDYSSQPFHRTNFIYNETSDTYDCPGGKTLIHYRNRIDQERKHEFKCFRTQDIADCKNCPLQKKCVSKGKVRRVIERETRQELKDEMKQRLNSEEGKEIYKKRLHPIEAIFGHAKHNLGYKQFLLRGIEKVKAEFLLICLSHNLRKLTAKVELAEVFSKVITLIICFRELQEAKLARADAQQSILGLKNAC